MSDFKSKLPDFNELTSMTGKLFKGIKNSIGEIIHDYKAKRAEPEETKPPEAPVVDPVAPEEKPQNETKSP